MITALSILVTFSIVVFVHELGHFLMALKMGVKVYTFSLGFGPEIMGFTYKGIRYRLSAIPMGGYVKMKGENPDDEGAMESDALMGLEPFRRIIILSAGALMNFLTGAIIFSMIIYFTGIPKFVDKPVIGGVTEESPADRAGIKEKDIILAINNKKINTWREVSEYIGSNTEIPVKLEIQRANEVLTIEVLPELNHDIGRALIGITATFENVKFGFISSVLEGFKYTAVLCWKMLASIWLMITGKIAGAVAGPVGIAQIVSKAASAGLSPLFQLIALISVNLGIINLFPIPILDGGHILFALVEKVKGSPLDVKKVNIANMIGLSLILALLLFFTWKDILRVFFKVS